MVGLQRERSWLVLPLDAIEVEQLRKIDLCRMGKRDPTERRRLDERRAERAKFGDVQIRTGRPRFVAGGWAALDFVAGIGPLVRGGIVGRGRHRLDRTGARPGGSGLRA